MEEWEIWDEEEEAAKLEAEARKLVLEKFHRWIKVFGKKQLERMPTRKLWDHVICTKEGESISLIERRERRGARVCKGAVEERLHSAIKVTANSASVLCGEEGWEEEDGSRLPIFE